MLSKIAASNLALVTVTCVTRHAYSSTYKRVSNDHLVPSPHALAVSR